MPGPNGCLRPAAGRLGLVLRVRPAGERGRRRRAAGLTILVNFATVLFIHIVAIPIAIYSATQQYSAGDYVATFIGFIGLATPNFLLALVLLYLANR